MKEVKDLFSRQAATYAAFRPAYPDELYTFLFDHITHFDNAWDCATGNGQAAIRLAERFKNVYATDISQSQLDNAIKNEKIKYSITRAEETPFPNQLFDLVTVGTGIHWFDFDVFYNEVKRVAKPDAIISVWCYNLLMINEDIDKIIRKLYVDITGSYWDKERKYVDDQYRTIPFPFEEIKAPKLEITVNWTREQLTGYLNSWSATQNYIDKENKNPVDIILPELEKSWHENEMKEVRFPLAIRTGRINRI